MLLRFDTLAIAFPRLYLDTDKYPGFARFPSKNHVDRYNYYLSNPCPGIIKIIIGDTEIIIEFSAKILKARYPELLTAATIETALNNILAASPLTFKVPDVLHLAHVLKAHQTQDLSLPQPFAAYAASLASLHVNREYRVVEYKDETVTYMQNATGKGREYLKIYDKAKEYARPANAEYRKRLTASERKTVAAYYAGKTRIETVFNGKRKLRQHFPDIDPKIMLTDLLHSTSNPLAEQFAEITKATYAAIEAPEAAKSLAFADTLSYKQAPEFAFLKEHGYDLDRIDARLKALNVKDRTASRERKKYAALLASYKAHEIPSPSVAALRELKAAIMIGDDTPKMAPQYPAETQAPNMAPATPTTALTTPAPIMIGDDTPKMAPASPLTDPDEDAAFFALLDSLDYDDEDEETAAYYTAQRI